MSAQPIHLTQPALIVGDVHGRHDLLRVLLAAHPNQHLVFVGDLIDRGPDSRSVVRDVRGLVERGQATLLLGNHEDTLIRAVHSGQRASWLRMGGIETLRSYARFPGELERDAQWLQQHARPWISLGTLFVSHAHRVSTPAERGSPTWLWGRPERCSDIRLPRGLSASVHGHTPFANAPVRQMVAGTPAYFIDSAAYATGVLSALDSQLQAYHITRRGSAHAPTTPGRPPAPPFHSGPKVSHDHP